MAPQWFNPSWHDDSDDEEVLINGVCVMQNPLGFKGTTPAASPTVVKDRARESSPGSDGLNNSSKAHHKSKSTDLEEEEEEEEKSLSAKENDPSIGMELTSNSRKSKSDKMEDDGNDEDGESQESGKGAHNLTKKLTAESEDLVRGNSVTTGPQDSNSDQENTD